MTVRSGQQQMNEEMAEMYKRMTDPEEIEKERMRQQEKKDVDEIINDAGL